MKKIYLLILLHPALTAWNLFAQNNDAQIWENIYLEKNITQRTYLHFNHEGRITDNVSRFGYGYADGGISFKITKQLHLSADYVFVIKKYYDHNVSYRNQYYLSATWKKKLNPLVFYVREMIQGEYDDIYSSPLGKIPSYYLRTKLTVKYNDLRRYIPYLAAELYYNTNRNQIYGAEFDRMRYFAGMYYKLSEINLIEAYYLIEDHFNVNSPSVNWVLGLGFEHTFY